VIKVSKFLTAFERAPSMETEDHWLPVFAALDEIKHLVIGNR